MFKPITTLIAYGLFIACTLFSTSISGQDYTVLAPNCGAAAGDYVVSVIPHEGRNQYTKGPIFLIRFNGSLWEIVSPSQFEQYFTAPDNSEMDPPLTGWNLSNAAGMFCTGAAELCVFGACPLPVELSFFKAREENGNVLLLWETASELNNMGFDIQRSANGLDWESLDFVKGQGTTDRTTEYSYIDETPNPGIQYYRLMQQDYDAAFEYSHIEAVELGRKTLNTVNVYPNPANNQIFFPITDGKLTIYNQLGQIMHYEHIANTRRLDISKLKNGIYMLEIITVDNKRSIGRFVKQTN